MQFLMKDKPLTYSEFSSLYPEEANILTEISSEDILFNIEEGGALKLLQDSYRPICINIDSELERHKIQFYKSSPYKELLAKALGLKAGKEKPKVLDATGGMLGDSLLIYAIGVESLTVCERHPIPAVLIYNALKFTQINISFRFCSATELEDEFDVIFYDPMYTEKNTKTNAKKEMMIFRNLIGVDLDSSEMALKLRDKASKRLIIKRSVKGASLIPKPDITFKGKSTAYDVYLKH